MIRIDLEEETYDCPFCGHSQAYTYSCVIDENGPYKKREPIPEPFKDSSFRIFYTSMYEQIL